MLHPQGEMLVQDGSPFKLWGLRVASAPIREAWTEELIAALPVYREHGINALYLCYQGSDGGFVPCFTSDGTGFSDLPAPVSGGRGPGISSGRSTHHRVQKIIRAAALREMAVVVSLFCGRAADFAAGELPLLQTMENAVALVAGELCRSEGTVMLDLSGDLGARLSPAAIAAFVAAAGRGDPDRRLLRCAALDLPGVQVVLTPDAWDGALARPIGKPVLISSPFGPAAGGYLEHQIDGSEPPFRPGYAVDYRVGDQPVRRYFGLHPEGAPGAGLYQAHATGNPDDGYRAGRHAYRNLMQRVRAEFSPYAGLFFHLPSWFEGAAFAQGSTGRGPGKWESRFTPGGDGTLQEPGIRWLLREVADGQ